jgi:hypothetical protein
MQAEVWGMLSGQYDQGTGGGIDRPKAATLGGQGDTTYERTEKAERTVRRPYLLL